MIQFAISPLVTAVHPPPISEVRSWLTEAPPGLPLIDLCQAIPNYSPAQELTGHLKGLLDDPQTARYTPDEGLAEVREAISARYGRVYGGAPGPDRICLTVGASQAYWLALVVLCRPGDEVIVQLPAYFDHPMALEMLGIQPVYAPFSEEEGGIPSPPVIESLITPRTRAILLVTPSNPTGAITPPETITELHAVARRHRLALVLDETYADFVPGGGPPHALFRDPHWDRHFVQVASFGKTYALTGYRAGALVAGADFIAQALKVQDTMTVCQPRLTQLAVGWAATHLDGWVAERSAEMTRRHELFRELFDQPGSPFRRTASGPFFAWVRHPWPGMTGREAARRLVREASLITLPGEVFGPGLEPYLRLAFGNVGVAAIPTVVDRFRNCAG